MVSSVSLENSKLRLRTLGSWSVCWGLSATWRVKWLEGEGHVCFRGHTKFHHHYTAIFWPSWKIDRKAVSGKLIGACKHYMHCVKISPPKGHPGTLDKLQLHIISSSEKSSHLADQDTS